ncbi:MAG: alanine racemase [Armatimonadota bacterium]
MNTYVEVNLAALAHNAKQVIANLHPQSRLLAVVKANAYGHGLVESARTFVASGAAWLGVSTVAEGVALREAGIDAPTLVFLPPLENEVEALVRHRLTGTLVAVRQVRQIANAAAALGQSAYCHVYIDSGLARIGSDDSLPDLIEAQRAFPSLHVTGLYTHFGPPGSGRMLDDVDILREGASVKAFAGLARDAMAQLGEARPMVHAAASTLFLEGKENHLDMVRAGTLLYGQYPDHAKGRTLDLREDTFALKTRIIALQTADTGAKVGYGGEFVCQRETRIATLPVGLAQGLAMVPQSLAGRWQTAAKAWQAKREAARGRTDKAPVAILNGQRVPLIGRVSMDQCCVDVTDVPGVEIGTEVALPVRRLAVDSGVPRVYITCEDVG